MVSDIEVGICHARIRNTPRHIIEDTQRAQERRLARAGGDEQESCSQAMIVFPTTTAYDVSASNSKATGEFCTHHLRLNSSITRMGSSLTARATSKNSIRSNRRSPFSNLETNDCGRPSFFAREACVRPARRRASVNNARKYRYLRLNADFGTPAVCNPESEYPKLGYALPWACKARRCLYPLEPEPWNRLGRSGVPFA